MPLDEVSVTGELDLPTPFTIAVMIDPAVDPVDGETDIIVGVSVMPAVYN